MNDLAYPDADLDNDGKGNSLDFHRIHTSPQPLFLGKDWIRMNPDLVSGVSPPFHMPTSPADDFCKMTARKILAYFQIN